MYINIFSHTRHIMGFVQQGRAGHLTCGSHGAFTLNAMLIIPAMRSHTKPMQRRGYTQISCRDTNNATEAVDDDSSAFVSSQRDYRLQLFTPNVKRIVSNDEITAKTQVDTNFRVTRARHSLKFKYSCDAMSRKAISVTDVHSRRCADILGSRLLAFVTQHEN